MNTLYETLCQLTSHLQATLPAEPSDEQKALLRSAGIHVNSVFISTKIATGAKPLIEAAQDMLDDHEKLAEIISGEARGSALLMRGIEEMVEAAGSMASSLTISY